MQKSNVFILLSFFYLTIQTDALSDDFRKSDWGDSRSAVIQDAGKPFQSKEDVLMYEVSISGIDGYLLYNFVAEKLSSAGYLFTESHSNDNTYISDYSKIQELMIKKYGKPISDKSVWFNDLYRDDVSQYGFAISIGHYGKQSTWATDRTKIFHTLHGDNYKISHGLNYSSKDLESLSEEVKDKAAMDQL